MSDMPLLSVRDVMVRLQLSERTVRTRMATGEIPFVKIGGAVRFDPRDLDAYIDRLRESK